MLFPSERPSRRGRRPRLVLAGATAALTAIVAFAAGVGSAASSAVPVNTSPPTISGTARVGSTLTATRGSWTNSPTSFKFEWRRCDSAGNNCTAVDTGSRYTLRTSDQGSTIRVNVTATNSSGSANATSAPTAVVQPGSAAPANTSKPTISGTLQEGQTLTASQGTWSGTNPISYSFQWMRCDSNGNNCAPIAGATGTTYNTTSSDVTHTLRVRVNARNSRGSASADSDPTSLIGPARGGGAAISVTMVNPPQRLVIDRVRFSPQPLGARRPLTGRFHVSDTRGFSVQGALVFALGIPYSWVRSGAEVATDSNGWATIVLRPTSALPLRHGTALVVFVRARKPGDNLLAGVSTRRLVQARIR